MPLKVALADYGVGNLHSIRKALENCGALVNVVEDMSLLTEAECIVLPGVGAFDKTMERLLPYREEIVQRMNEGVPCLGICIGKLIMFQGSAEGSGPGLGFCTGTVVRLRPRAYRTWAGTCADGRRYHERRGGHAFYSPTPSTAARDGSEWGTRLLRTIRRFHKSTLRHAVPPEKSPRPDGLLNNFVRFAEVRK